MRAASAAKVVIYTVNPSGLEAPAPTRPSGGNFEAAMSAAREGQTRTRMMAARRAGPLWRLAESTGGTLTVDRNDLRAGIRDMLQDGRAVYRMTYAQPEIAPGAEAAVRSVVVNVKRKGLTVRARRHYVAP